MTQPQPLDLDVIDTVIAAYQQHPDLGFACCSAHPAADAATALAAEIRRLRTDDPHAEIAKLIRWHGEDETAMTEMRATITRLRTELAAANSRLAEPGRPDVEARRRRITDSFRELAAQAREDRDFEGEASVLLLLEERQEQWAAIDAASATEHTPAAEETHVVADDSKADTLPAWLHQRFGTRGQHAQTWDALTDDDRDYWKHETAAVRRAVARGGFKTDRAAVSAAARP